MSAPSSPRAAAELPPGGSGWVARFTVLHGAAPELWVVFLVKLLGVVAYSLMNTTFALWLFYDLGYSDQAAGFVVGAWSTAMTLFTVLVGSLADAIGLRRALLLGLVVAAVSRGVLAFTTVKWLALAGGMLPLALGESLGVPVLVAGVRRYTTDAQRSFAFGVFYAMMNAGFLIANPLFDFFRARLGEHGHFVLPLLGLPFTTYRTLFLASLLVELPLLPLVYFGLRGGAAAIGPGLGITPEAPGRPGGGLAVGLVRMTGQALRDTVRIFGGLWRQPGFYRFLLFLTLAAFVRLIFIHMYYTYPKFGIRELGDGAPVGSLFAINSLLIVGLAPLVGALCQRIPAYRMVTFGSSLAAASVFIMTLPPAWFAPLADGPLGHGIANAWLGGDTRFSPEDVRDAPALAARLLNPKDPVETQVANSLGTATRALLRRAVEDGATAVAPTTHPGTVAIAPGELADTSALVARLRDDPTPASRPVSRFIWDGLSAAAQARLADLACPEPRRQALLAERLNHLLYGAALSDNPCLAGVELSAAARALQARATASGGVPAFDALPLLHRVLLEDLYPRHVPRSLHPLRAALAADLTQAIRGDLAAQPGFSPAALSEPARQLLAAHPKGKSRVRLNRLVLEDGFAPALARNRVGEPGSVNPYYVMIVLFMVMLSLGEAFYSPRLYEYAAVIAPAGQEASYMSLSYLPFFLAKLVAASCSGVLLAAFCPQAGPRHSQELWLVIALTALVAPVGLVLLRRFIDVDRPRPAAARAR